MKVDCEEAVDTVTLLLSACNTQQEQTEMMKKIITTEEVVRNEERGIPVINWEPDCFQELYYKIIKEDMAAVCLGLISQIRGLMALISNDGCLEEWIEIEGTLDLIMKKKVFESGFYPETKEFLEELLGMVKISYKLD